MCNTHEGAGARSRGGFLLAASPSMRRILRGHGHQARRRRLPVLLSHKASCRAALGPGVIEAALQGPPWCYPPHGYRWARLYASTLNRATPFGDRRSHVGDGGRCMLQTVYTVQCCSGAVRRALVVNAAAKSATISIVASTTVYAVRSPTQHLACEATTHFPELHSSTIITWPCRGFVTSSAMSHAKYAKSQRCLWWHVRREMAVIATF